MTVVTANAYCWFVDTIFYFLFALQTVPAQIIFFSVRFNQTLQFCGLIVKWIKNIYIFYIFKCISYYVFDSIILISAEHLYTALYGYIAKTKSRFDQHLQYFTWKVL